MADLNAELIKTLKETNEYLRSENEKLLKQMSELNQNIANLQETIDYLKRKLYGTSSERSSKDVPGQMTLFNETEMTADETVPEPTAEEAVAGYLRNKAGNKSSREGILAGLPAEKVYCDIPEEERVCELCGTPLEFAGEKFIREELQIIPAKVKRIHYYAKTYYCPKCKEEDGVFESITAESPSPLLKHSLASPSTVAHIMTQVYAYAMPYYRMEMQWLQEGVKLPRARMAHWVIYCAKNYLKPVYQRLHEHLVKRDVLHADEVPCQVLREDGRPAKAKSYMWIYLTGDDGGPGIVLYNYKPGRKGEYAKGFLKGFSGFLHCDGYQGYNSLEDVIRVGCIAHLRRKFFDAIPVNKSEGSHNLPAEVGVRYINQLFEIERTLKDCDPTAKKAKRLKLEAPILVDFFDWVEGLTPVSGSKLDKAVTYARNQRKNIENVFLDGRLELTNSAAERKAKSYVIGRKNFLFHDTVDGAEASAICYSLVETAKANNLNIFQYLKTLLLFMPDYINEPEGIEELMPWSDFIQATCPGPHKQEPEIRLKS